MPIVVNAIPEKNCCFDFEAKIKIQGNASAIWIGLAIRLGTNPEKISHMWKIMDVAPSTTQQI